MGAIRCQQKLTELTQQGKLHWEIRDYPSSAAVVGPSYLAEYNDRLLRLEKVQTDEMFDEVILDFVEPDQKTSLWTFPSSTGLDALYGAVRYRTAGASDFLDSLLRDD